MPAAMIISILVQCIFGAAGLAFLGLKDKNDTPPVATVYSPALAGVPLPAGAITFPSKPPPVREIVKDSVNNPWSLFGLAALGFVSVFVISQMRAGFHEVSATTADLYEEGKKATQSLANADAGTGNISRRLGKGK